MFPILYFPTFYFPLYFPGGPAGEGLVGPGRIFAKAVYIPGIQKGVTRGARRVP